MVKNLGILILIFCLINASRLHGQSFNIGQSMVFYIGSEATFYVGGHLNLEGRLNNQGELQLNSDILFVQNDQAGDLTFLGSNDQEIRGQEIESSQIEIRKSGTLHLLANSLVTQRLALQNGIFKTTRNNTLIVEDGRSITGGSSRSYIEGKLMVKSQSDNGLRFPMGLSGFYNEISFSNVPEGDILQVILQDPGDRGLFPGDSLVGVADEHEWEVRYFGISDFQSIVTTIFDGVDLQNFNHHNEIMANRYSPVVAHYLADSAYYHPLGLRDLSQTDNLTFGTLLSRYPIQLVPDKLEYLGIGLMPVPDGPKFYVPNAFSPNGNFNENQKFRPYLEGFDIYSIDFQVWDRFNNSVYQVNETDPTLELLGWDGTLTSGLRAPEGIYYFKVFMETEEGNFSKSGTVVLLR